MLRKLMWKGALNPQSQDQYGQHSLKEKKMMTIIKVWMYVTTDIQKTSEWFIVPVTVEEDGA